MKGIPLWERLLFLFLIAIYDISRYAFSIVFYNSQDFRYFLLRRGYLTSVMICLNINTTYLWIMQIIRVFLIIFLNGILFYFGIIDRSSFIHLSTINTIQLFIEFTLSMVFLRNFFKSGNQNKFYYYLLIKTIIESLSCFFVYMSYNYLISSSITNQMLFKNLHAAIAPQSTLLTFKGEYPFLSSKTFKNILYMGANEMEIFWSIRIMYILSNSPSPVSNIVKNPMPKWVLYTFSTLVFIGFLTKKFALIGGFIMCFCLHFVSFFAVKIYCTVYGNFLGVDTGFSFAGSMLLRDGLNKLPAESQMIFSTIMIFVDRVINYK